MTPFVAEFLGTMILILLGNGVVANTILSKTKGHGGGWVVITLAWGFAVFAGVLVAQDYSGAHLNPAVTLGLAAAGKFATSQIVSYIIAQMLGAAIGMILVVAMYYDHYAATDDPGTKLATFSTGPAIPHTLRNLLSEIIGTFVLVMAALSITGPNFLAADPDAPAGLGSVGAIPIALIVIAIGMSLGGTTGYAINPARDLAPRIMHQLLPIPGKGDSDWRYAWIPIIGPVIGGILAALLYLALDL